MQALSSAIQGWASTAVLAWGQAQTPFPGALVPSSLPPQGLRAASFLEVLPSPSALPGSGQGLYHSGPTDCYSFLSPGTPPLSFSPLLPR